LILELLITFELVAFSFLALGIIPFKRINDDGNLPLVNKVLFIFVAAIIFFSLAVSSVSYDYTYCFVNETSVENSATTSVSTATCEEYKIEDQGIAYINWGMGILSILVGLIILLITGLSRHDTSYDPEK